MIHVIATIELTEGKRPEFLREFKKVMPLVQAEQGCLLYTPTLDVATNIAAQGGVRENVVTVVEQWRNLEDLEHHLVAPHMIEYRNRVRGMVAGTRLQILQPA